MDNENSRPLAARGPRGPLSQSAAMDPELALIPRYDISPQASDSPAQRFDCFREQARPLFDVEPRTPLKRFHGEVVFHNLDNLIVCNTTFSALHFVHEPSGGLEGAIDLLLLEIYQEGEGRGVADGRTTLVNPVVLHLVDLSRPFQTTTTRVRTTGLCIPHAIVGYDPARHRPYYSLAMDSVQGQMLAGVIGTLNRQLDRITLSEAPALAAGITQLVRALLLDGVTEETAPAVDSARQAAIRTYIEKHLADPSLDGDRLCKALGMSRSTLYRHFKESGGISRYINDRRLAQCMSELRRAPATGDRVHEIASRWGFSDSGYFYRRFKAKFGMSPSECFEAIEPDPSKPGELSLPRAGRTQVPLLDWLRGDT